MKMPLKCSNNAQRFCLTKMLEKNASIMYKSLEINHQGRVVQSWVKITQG